MKPPSAAEVRQADGLRSLPVPVLPLIITCYTSVPHNRSAMSVAAGASIWVECEKPRSLVCTAVKAKY